MPVVELIMPKMGESVMEATIIHWLKAEGEKIEEDETLLEVATDKVDSEVPSPYSGTLKSILHPENSVVEVGKPLALIEIEGDESSVETKDKDPHKDAEPEKSHSPASHSTTVLTTPKPTFNPEIKSPDTQGSKEERYYSPLVRSIAKAEGIPISELNKLDGTGGKGRLTKRDVLDYVGQRVARPGRHQIQPTDYKINQPPKDPGPESHHGLTPRTDYSSTDSNDNVEIIEMDRMRRLIADHMLNSKATSAHVTSFVEADVTNMVRWRNHVKEDFYNRHSERLTFTPLFIECVIKALHDFPKINSSIVGNAIHIKRNLNIGVATALPNGNLIVPVIHAADELSLIGLAKKVNDLSNRARANKLKPHEIQNGTFTMSNIGTFGNLMGTPIINQPEVAVLALGAIKKKPVVLETKGTDTIAIRHMMFLSLSYDHRIIDGFYGGSFLNRIAEYIENFDPDRKL